MQSKPKRRWVCDLGCKDYRIYLDIEIRRSDCPRCMKVKQEKPDWLAVNPIYSKRFARFVARLGVDEIAVRKGATYRSLKLTL